MPIQTNASDIHLRSSQTTGLQSSNALSISVWINATWTGGARLSMVGIYGPSTDVALGSPVTAVQIGSGAGGGDLTCWTWGGSTLVGTAAGTMTAFNGLWLHIVYTFDGTNHTVYRNGAQLATATNAANPQLPGFLNQVYINGFPGGGTSEVGAFEVDGYTLYRRTLTASEVQTIYEVTGMGL
jgi:Concanavalin A-like lectin/glucanases superfamily